MNNNFQKQKWKKYLFYMNGNENIFKEFKKKPNNIVLNTNE